MLGFGKKHNKKQANESGKSEKKRGGLFHNNDKEKSSSVINETTPNSALDIFDATPKLSASVNNQTKYIGLLFNMDDPKIGGINKTRRKDETIGDLIEAINQDRIQVYAPAELLDENKLVIIPTLQSLSAMSEYNILTNDNFKYPLALVSQDGNIGITQATINFDEMQRFMNDPEVNGDDLLSDKGVIENKEPDTLQKQADNTNLGDANNDDNTEDDPLSALTSGVPDEVSSNSSQNQAQNNDINGIDDADLDDDEVQDSEPSPQTQADSSDQALNDKPVLEPVANEQAVNDAPMPDDMPFGADEETNNSLPDDAISDDVTEQTQAENEPVNNQAPQESSTAPNNNLDWSGDDSEGLEDNGIADDDDDKIVSPEDTYKAITRTFYSNDLDLKISTEPIDDLLNADNKFVPFDEDRGDGYLNEYLNQMAKEANQQLKTEHETHKSIVRNMYYDLITKSAEDLTAKVDENDENTEFGKRRLDIIKSVNDQKDDAKFREQVEQKKKSFEDEFNERAKKDGERARDQAIASYKERFGGELDAKLANVEADVRNEIDHMYNEQMKDLHTDQKNAAAALWDNMESIAIGKALNRYKALRKQEALHETNWRKKMRDFANNHRKEAVTHDEIVKRELDQDKRAKELEQQYTNQINRLEADNKARQQDAQRRLADLEKQYKLDLANTKAQVEAENRAKHDREIADLKMANDKQVSQLQLDLQERSSQANGYKLEVESEKLKNKNLQVKLDTLDERKNQELSDKFKVQYNGQIEALKSNNKFLEEQSKDRASQIKAVKRSRVVSNVAIALLSVVLSSGATFGVMKLASVNTNTSNTQATPNTVTKNEAQEMIDSAKKTQQAEDQVNQQKAINDALDKFKKEQADAQAKQNKNGNIQNQSYQVNTNTSSNNQ